jgi:hypothetical protein
MVGTDELETVRKVTVAAWSRLTSRHLTEGTEKRQENRQEGVHKLYKRLEATSNS